MSLVRVRDCLGGSALGAEFRDRGLADDGSDFAHAGGEAVRGGAVAGGETFAGDDKGCCVGAWGWGVSFLFLFGKERERGDKPKLKKNCTST